MQRVHLRIGAVLALALLVATGSGCSCGGSSSGPIVQPPPATAVVARKVSATFVDATTGAPMRDVVSVTVRDRDGSMSAVTLDGAGKARNAFTAKNGILGFQVDPKAALPVHLTLIASAPGYVGTSAKVDLVADGAVGVTARMVSLSAPPVGVASVQQFIGTASANGTLPVAVSVATAPEAQTAGTASLSIPANTVVTTASGTPLQGVLTASVTYFNNQDPSSLEAFPGGLAVSVARTLGSPKEDGAFISGGFSAITVTDEAGNVAHHFSQPIAIRVSVPAATVNPSTKLPVAPGDTIPFWSYDEANGQWQPEGTVTVVADANGNLAATGTVNHLSYVNLDWLQFICPSPAPITITGNPDQLRLDLELSVVNGGYAQRISVPGDAVTTDLRLFNMPSGSPMRATALFRGAPVGSVDIDDLCGGSGVTLPVTLPAVRATSLTVRVENVCSEDGNARSASASATVGLYDSTWNSDATTTNERGEAIFKGLLEGETYRVYVSAMTGEFWRGTKTVVAGGNVVQVLLERECKLTGVTGGSSQ